MAVKVGNSWVSEAAYAYAKSRVDKEEKEKEEGKSVLEDLQDKYSDTNFRAGTAPFQGSGLNNISIAPNILREMEKDPEKRLEYEALIYDCVSVQKSLANQKGLKAHGFIITEDGGLRAWGISQAGDNNKSVIPLSRNKKGSWMQELLDSLNTAKKKKAKETAAQKEKEKSQTITFSNVDELSDYLFSNYKTVNKGMVKISKSYLKACVNDEEKRKKLFENLKAADEMEANAQENVKGYQGMKITIDSEGNMETETYGGSVSVNEGKRLRQISAAKNSQQVQAVLALLNTDLAQCQEGIEKGMCDENEVNKVRALMQKAMQRMGEVAVMKDNGGDDTEGFDAFSINMLI